jgi:hypothetical protein
MFRPLHQMVCSHSPGTHTTAGGAQREDGTWNSAPAAAYPADFNLFMCDAIALYIFGRDLTAPAVATVPAANVVDPGDASPPPQSGLGADAQPTASTAPPAPPTAAPPQQRETPPPPSPPPLAVPPPSPDTPSPTRQQRRGRIPADERFQRTLGSIRDSLRPRGAAKQARGADGSPANRREAIADDEEGWVTAEGGEITNHESKTSWLDVPSTLRASSRPPPRQAHLGLHGQAQPHEEGSTVRARLHTDLGRGLPPNILRGNAGRLASRPMRHLSSAWSD